MKKQNQYILLFIILFIIGGCNPTIKNQGISLIPRPNNVILQDGVINYSLDISIVYKDNILENEAKYLAEALKSIVGKEIDISSQQMVGHPSILLILNDRIEGTEAYTIKTTPEGIIIKAKTSHGIFYGIQTLLQLIFSQNNNDQSINLPVTEIRDSPRYVWRGMHLDVARHFFPVSFVKKMIDMLAMHKMNTFHWHLTEDQGWRIEIKKYPKLTEIGSKRDETLIGHSLEYPKKFDGTPYEGFYTRDEIKEVVKYAQSRHITIVPEIEMPGHAQAAIASYPELSCFPDKKVKPWTEWGVSQNVYCAGKEETFKFLENVLSEVIELFPGEYIHIGGDECPKNHWINCPLCQKRIKEEGLQNEHELQSYFIKRIEKFLSSKGKKLIGWDEILEGGLADGAAVMSWRGEKGGIEAASMGHPVVMTPTGWCYFDQYQSINHNEPKSIGGIISLEKVYNYDPTPNQIPDDKKDLVLGTQANIWTEYISTTDRAEYMIFPRLCALAEVCWTNPENKNYDDFKFRMNDHYIRLINAGVNFRLPTPEGPTNIRIYNRLNIKLPLYCDATNAEIYYTIDGSEPDENSIKYKDPIKLNLAEDIELKSISMLFGKKSITNTFSLKQLKQKPATYTNQQQGLICTKFSGPFNNTDEIGGTPKDQQIVEKVEIPKTLCDSLSGWEINGFVLIDASGEYTFELNSSYESALHIANQKLINKSIINYWNKDIGKVSLEKGLYPISIKYCNKDPRCYIELKYSGPNFKMKSLPMEKLFH